MFNRKCPKEEKGKKSLGVVKAEMKYLKNDIAELGVTIKQLNMSVQEVAKTNLQVSSLIKENSEIKNSIKEISTSLGKVAMLERDVNEMKTIVSSIRKYVWTAIGTTGVAMVAFVAKSYFLAQSVTVP